VIVPTQAIINLASENELCPPIRVKRFKVATKVKEPATWMWVQAFRYESSPHLGALATFMFLTGARISEALSVRWTDLNIGSREVIVRMGKTGGDERVANLPPELVVMLANLERKNDYVFRFTSRHNIRTQWESAIRRAGIKRLTPHSMRHGFATEMLRAGYDVKTVAHAGGWKDAATVLKTYAHAIRDIRITDALTGGEMRKEKSA
jgi:integrase